MAPMARADFGDICRLKRAIDVIRNLAVARLGADRRDDRFFRHILFLNKYAGISAGLFF
jgi:hypothetical protein